MAANYICLWYQNFVIVTPSLVHRPPNQITGSEKDLLEQHCPHFGKLLALGTLHGKVRSHVSAVYILRHLESWCAQKLTKAQSDI